MPRPRRLILMLDGTWNDAEFGEMDTNIVRLRDTLADGMAASASTPVSIAEAVENDSPSAELGIRPFGNHDYLFYYQRGVGNGSGFDRLTGGALGWGLGQNVRRAYKFLSRHYIPGADIFVFGFSRGAYTARTLVGYLGASGLLKPEYCDHEREKLAWSNYRTRPDDRLPGTRFSLEPYVHPFGELRVACLGVFDTVGALGIPEQAFRRLNREFYEFHDIELSPLVRLNLHALAIDEHRLPFAASVWRQSRFRWGNSVTEQTWFTGVHSDVGGGYCPRKRIRPERELDDITLDWMFKRVQHHYTDFPRPKFAGVFGAPRFALHHNSRRGKYRLSPTAIRSVGNLPLEPPRRYTRIVSYDRGEGVVGESVHISALERLGALAPYGNHQHLIPYLPVNLIEAIPGLYERYCVKQTREFEREALGVTDWSGEVVHETTSSPDVVARVAHVIVEACARLDKHGARPVAAAVSPAAEL
jgi:hypothetical protein